MKIAFIGGRNIHLIGGIESYTYNLCTKLKEMGHEPLVYCESDHDEEEMVNGFKVIHFKSPKSKYLTKPIVGIRAIWHTIRNFPDIKIYHFNAAGPAYGAWLARLFNKTTILQLHGIETRRTKWNAKQRALMTLTGAMTRKVCTKYCTSVSKEQTDLVNQGRIFNKCVYIPTAVNLPSENIESNVLARFELEKNKYFLYLGRLVQDKNPDYLIKAFIASGIKDYKLVIAGNNSSNPNYVKYLHDLGTINKNVVFTDAVYGPDKEKLLQCCYGFCIPSTIEGLSISLLEAMSYGKPIIASDIPANHESVGENALWVKAEDADSLRGQLIKAITDDKFFTESGKKNRELVEKNFTWSIIAEKYINFVKEL